MARNKQQKPIQMMSNAQWEKAFPDEDACDAYLVQHRWPNGVTCPRCGSDHVYKMLAQTWKWECMKCGKSTSYRFSDITGTIFENTNVDLRKWFRVIHLMLTAKKGVSAMQVQRFMGFGSYKTAWYMCHRIRVALMDIFPQDMLVGTVEADETYIGGKRRGKRHGMKRGRGHHTMENKIAVVSAVERGGRVRSQVSDVVTGHLVGEFLAQHVSKDAHLHTDESVLYRKPGKRYASHNTVKHKEEEYVRYVDGGIVTTNAIEGFFGNTKRSIDGTHHQVSRKHLPLYLAEIDYKYNTREMTDGARTAGGIPKIVGKRLMLRRPAVRT